jgi:hypothetical protein
MASPKPEKGRHERVRTALVLLGCFQLQCCEENGSIVVFEAPGRENQVERKLDSLGNWPKTRRRTAWRRRAKVQAFAPVKDGAALPASVTYTARKTLQRVPVWSVWSAYGTCSGQASARRERQHSATLHIEFLRSMLIPRPCLVSKHALANGI